MKNMVVVLLLTCFVACTFAHSLFVLPQGYSGAASSDMDPTQLLSYLLHGSQPPLTTSTVLQHHQSLLQKPSANALFTVHSTSVDLSSALPETYQVVRDRAMHTLASGDHSHDCTFVTALAQDKSATTFMAPAPSCAHCEASTDSCSLSWSSQKGFINVNGEAGHVEKRLLQQKLAEGPFGAEVEVDTVNNVVIVAVGVDKKPVSLDLTDEAVAQMVYHSVMLTMLPSLLPTAQLLSVLVDVNTLQAASEKFGQDSLEFNAVMLIVDRALATVVPQLEEQFAARGMTTELLVMDCVGEEHHHNTEVNTRRTLATSSSSVLVSSSSSRSSSSSGSSTNSTNDYNTVGSDQILIWLTVGLILLVALGGYVMTACGVDATKDSLLYFKTTTYH